MIEANFRIIFKSINGTKLTENISENPELLASTKKRMDFLRKELENGFKKTKIDADVAYYIKPLKDGEY